MGAHAPVYPQGATCGRRDGESVARVKRSAGSFASWYRAPPGRMRDGCE